MSEYYEETTTDKVVKWSLRGFFTALLVAFIIIPGSHLFQDDTPIGDTDHHAVQETNRAFQLANEERLNQITPLTDTDLEEDTVEQRNDITDMVEDEYNRRSQPLQDIIGDRLE